jgi:maltooligosyltrehalose trehalohydrolase
LVPQPGRPGWFTGADPPADASYDVLLDGTLVRPDPRARRLPAGVHGAAAGWDPAAARWTDHGWPGRALDHTSVVYELHLGTFTAGGTFATAVPRLDHLVELGITHVELMPVNAFDGPRGWGYDGVAIDAVHEPYGGPAGLCAFVDAAHARGLAVLLDVVHNHLGPSGNSWASFGPFVTDRYATPWGGAVNLDGPGSDDVRAILLDSVTGWLRDFHLDGLRLDAVHELHDDRARHYLQELSDEVAGLADRLGRPLCLVAESDRNDPRTVTPVVDGGFGMTAQWDDDVHHALHWLLTGETAGYYADFGSCQEAAHTLERAFRHDGRYSTFRGRTHGAPVDFARTGPERFVVASQTHDQVGNRAGGERLVQLAGPDRAAAAAALLLTLPYLPMLFMGQEWGASTPWQFFSSFSDPALAAAVTAGRRREFADHGWSEQVPDPQALETFAASVLDWSEPSAGHHAELLAWHRTLIGLRSRLPAPAVAASGTADGLRCDWAEDDGRPVWFAVQRRGWLTAVNLGPDPVMVPLPSPSATVEASWLDGTRIVPAGVALPPGGTAVLRLGADPG